MAKLYRRAGKVARGEVPVLILGESGSGKEVMARWLHARSRRAAGPFLAVNCAALPKELLESELFGIEKGVATGVEARPGLLERGSGGTVFLDEVGDMAPETQAKVLRMLENPTLFRVGGRTPVQVDVRFVAATNRDLEALVEEGGFRRDLYHRLAAFEVKLPPLRERREEIPALAARFFHRELAKSGAASPGITRAALGGPGPPPLAGQRPRAAERDRQGGPAPGAGRAPRSPAPLAAAPRLRGADRLPHPRRDRPPGRARSLRGRPRRRRRGRRPGDGDPRRLADDVLPEAQGAGIGVDPG